MAQSEDTSPIVAYKDLADNIFPYLHTVDVWSVSAEAREKLEEIGGSVAQHPAGYFHVTFPPHTIKSHGIFYTINKETVFYVDIYNKNEALQHIGRPYSSFYARHLPPADGYRLLLVPPSAL